MAISDQTVDRIWAILGLFIVGIFVLGLAWGISHGFAGFWGGLPFWCISLFVLALIGYDVWTTLFRSEKK